MKSHNVKVGQRWSESGKLVWEIQSFPESDIWKGRKTILWTIFAILVVMAKRRKVLKTRSYAAVAMILRGGSGKHGGSKRARNRKNRKRAKNELRSSL